MEREPGECIEVALRIMLLITMNKQYMIFFHVVLDIWYLESNSLLDSGKTVFNKQM